MVFLLVFVKAASSHGAGGADWKNGKRFDAKRERIKILFRR
jgi:hypothetical protein